MVSDRSPLYQSHLPRDILYVSFVSAEIIVIYIDLFEMNLLEEQIVHIYIYI